MENKGASVVINHAIKDGKQEQYDTWLDEISSICRKLVGHIDWQVIRPIPNLTFNYTVIIRFDTIEHLKNSMESPERRELIEKAKPLLAKEDKYVIKSGLDFLFTLENEKTKVPVRWKQYLVTWSGIYPLSLLVPFLVLPILKVLHFPENRFLNSFFITGIIVFIMIYLLMPNYTKLIKKWLFK